MRIVGVVLALVGWLIPVVGLTITQSTSARFILALLGIAVTLFAIMGVLNKAHLKNAIWKS
jgi:hypothetical protein